MSMWSIAIAIDVFLVSPNVGAVDINERSCWLAYASMSMAMCLLLQPSCEGDGMPWHDACRKQSGKEASHTESTAKLDTVVFLIKTGTLIPASAPAVY